MAARGDTGENRQRLTNVQTRSSSSSSRSSSRRRSRSSSRRRRRRRRRKEEEEEQEQEEQEGEEEKQANGSELGTPPSERVVCDIPSYTALVEMACADGWIDEREDVRLAEARSKYGIADWQHGEILARAAQKYRKTAAEEAIGMSVDMSVGVPTNMVVGVPNATVGAGPGINRKGSEVTLPERARPWSA